MATPAVLDLNDQQRALLHVLFDQAPIAIAILRGPDHVIEVANPTALRIWRSSDPRQAIGRPLFELAPQLADQGFEEVLRAVLTDGRRVVGREVLVKLPNAETGALEERYFDFTYEPLRDAQGANESVLAIATDVTESVRLRFELTDEADAALRATRDRAQRIGEAVSIGTWEIDLVTQRVIADRNMLDIFGVGANDPQDLESYLDRLAAEDRNRIAATIDATLGGANDGVLVAETRLAREHHGKPRWLEGRGKADFDAEGRPIRFVGTVVDITVRKEAELERERLLVSEQEARRRNEALLFELQTADQRKDEFLATLAHELRNPMAAISTALMLIENAGGEPDKSARYQTTAKRQMNNLVRMVDDLLDVARITRGKIELRNEEIDLARVVQDAIAAARPTLDARQHELTVTIGAGAFRMQADTTRLEQIVSNLLSNAARYTEPRGHITVQLRHETVQGAPFAALRVCDTGRGIPAAMLFKIFDPFTQVDPSIDRSTGGLGLGLTLVRRLAEMHGGTVEALSEGLGLGSTFVVRLPLLDEAQARAEQIAKLESVRPPSASRRILLVDDSEDSREMLRELLETMGHEVFAAEDGLQGAARAGELRPDIALIDIGLPGIDGYEVARRIRSANDGSPYLVALTGYGSPEAKAKATAAGFDLHLTNPVDLKKLLDVIQRAHR